MGPKNIRAKKLGAKKLRGKKIRGQKLRGEIIKEAQINCPHLTLHCFKFSIWTLFILDVTEIAWLVNLNPKSWPKTEVIPKRFTSNGSQNHQLLYKKLKVANISSADAKL